MNRTWHETAWTEPEPGPDLGPVQQVQVPNLGPEPNFGIASHTVLYPPPQFPSGTERFRAVPSSSECFRVFPTIFQLSSERFRAVLSNSERFRAFPIYFIKIFKVHF